LIKAVCNLFDFIIYIYNSDFNPLNLSIFVCRGMFDNLKLVVILSYKSQQILFNF